MMDIINIQFQNEKVSLGKLIINQPIFKFIKSQESNKNFKKFQFIKLHLSTDYIYYIFSEYDSIILSM